MTNFSTPQYEIKKSPANASVQSVPHATAIRYFSEGSPNKKGPTDTVSVILYWPQYDGLLEGEGCMNKPRPELLKRTRRCW